MDIIFIEILQLNCYAVPELPPSRNPLHNCIFKGKILYFDEISPEKSKKKKNLPVFRRKTCWWQ